MGSVRVHYYVDEFQSTHPVRGGTFALEAVEAEERDFNPPTP